MVIQQQKIGVVLDRSLFLFQTSFFTKLMLDVRIFRENYVQVKLDVRNLISTEC